MCILIYITITFKHIKILGKLNTLVVIKSENNNIFGGYTEQDWSGN